MKRGYTGSARSTQRQLLADAAQMMDLRRWFVDQHEMSLMAAADIRLRDLRRGWLCRFEGEE